MTWKVIPDFPNYEISREGEVRNITTGRLKTIFTHNGYPCVRLSKDKVATNVKLHILLMLTFVGPRPEGQVIRHLDDCRTNNCLDNLCYGTRSENARDAIANGIFHCGERTGPSKLTERKVRIMRGLRKLGYTLKRLGEIFDITPSNVCYICKRKTWAHVE